MQGLHPEQVHIVIKLLCDLFITALLNRNPLSVF